MPIENENLWIVALLFILVIIGANVLTLGMARGARDFKGKDYFNLGNATKPWKKEDANLQELRQRVKGLQEKDQEHEQ